MKLIDQLLELVSFYSEKPNQREFAFVRAVSMITMVTAPLVFLLTRDRFASSDVVMVFVITGCMLGIFLGNLFVPAFRKVAIYFLYSMLYLIVLYLLINAHRYQYNYNSAFQLTIGFFSVLLFLRKQAQVVYFSLGFLALLLISIGVVEETQISKGFLVGFTVCYIVITILVMNYRIKLRDRLEAEQDFLSALFNNSFDAVFLVEYYSNKIEDCNAVALKMFELESKKALQSSILLE